MTGSLAERSLISPMGLNSGLSIEGMPSFGGPPERISCQPIRDLLKSVLLQPSCFQRAGSALATDAVAPGSKARHSSNAATPRAGPRPTATWVKVLARIFAGLAGAPWLHE